jgi:hypothetical protein
MASVRVRRKSNRTEPKRVKTYEKLRNALKNISVVGIGLHFLRTKPNRNRDRFEKLRTDPISALNFKSSSPFTAVL